MPDLKQSNEEYWNVRKAERKGMRRPPLDFDQFSASMARKVFSDAEEVGVPQSHIDAMKGRMRKWHEMCKAYRRDFGEVIRKAMPAEDKRQWIAQMRADQDAARVEIFGE